MKTIKQFEIINHGVEHAQYFQGCGVSNFKDVATGCGSTEKEALDDALDSLAQNDWDVEPLALSDDYQGASLVAPDEIANQGEDGELYVYCSVRVTDKPDYSLMSYDEEMAILEEIVSREGANILSIGDVHSILREHFNNEILDTWESRHYSKP